MIRFEKIREPATFDRDCRSRGLCWLAKHGHETRPPDYWTEFKGLLAAGFKNLCAYSAMYEPVGTVDHFVCCEEDPRLAYEWSNYRFASAWINSCKQNSRDNLDPFAVEDEWFEILLPSLQLVMTDHVPKKLRQTAESMLSRLHLRNDERVMRQRRKWMELYEQKHIDLIGLHEMAPLLARAIEVSGLRAEIREIVANAHQIYQDAPQSRRRVDGHIKFCHTQIEAKPGFLVSMRAGDRHLARYNGNEVFPMKAHYERCWASEDSVQVLLIIRNSDGRIRFMNATEAILAAQKKAPGKSVKQIAFKGEEFNKEAVLRLRDERLGKG